MKNNVANTCLSCVLTECDFMHKDCQLKRANAQYSRMQRAGERIPNSVRDGASAWNLACKIERAAKQSEARI